MSDAMWNRLIGPEANARIKREDEAQRRSEREARESFVREHTCQMCGAWLADVALHNRWHEGVTSGT